MKTKSIIYLAFLLMIPIGALNAYAVGTPAGTSISNTATANFSVGGTPQSPVSSPPISFIVDQKINLTVAESGGGYNTVLSGATDQAMKFTITNLSNDVLDFRLGYTPDTTGAADPFGGTDDFDTTNVEFFLDNGDGVFTAADTKITFLDNVPADATRTIFVVSDIPTGQPNDNTSSGTLTATAAKGGGGGLGADLTETTGANTSGVDVVFADLGGDTDIAGDGKHSDDDAYKVSMPTVGLVKIFTIISDPENGTTNPKAIPGAVVEYCIQASNSGSSAADDVIITDPIPVNSTYVAGTIIAGGTVTGSVCNADGTAEDDDTTGGDDTLSLTENTGSFASNTVTTTVKSLAAGATTASRFRVTLN